jgi:hypothetical protein
MSKLMNARNQARRENPDHGFWALSKQRTEANAPVLRLQTRPDRSERYGQIVDEIVSV